MNVYRLHRLHWHKRKFSNQESEESSACSNSTKFLSFLQVFFCQKSSRCFETATMRHTTHFGATPPNNQPILLARDWEGLRPSLPSLMETPPPIKTATPTSHRCRNEQHQYQNRSRIIFQARLDQLRISALMQNP